MLWRMALIDKLRDIGDFPPSHVPALNEIAELVGKLAAYVEHGDTLFDVARDGAQALSALLGRDDQAQPTPAPQAAPQAPAPAAAATSAPEPSQEDVADEQLFAQFMAWKANQQRTQVSVEPLEATDPGEPAADSSESQG